MITIQSSVKASLQRELNLQFCQNPSYRPTVASSYHDDKTDSVKVTVNITVNGIVQAYYLLYHNVSIISEDQRNILIALDVFELYIKLVMLP